MFIIALSLLFASFGFKIDFYSPENLTKLYKESSLKYNLLNMGDIPYGRSIIGRVFKASPYNGCKPL